MTVPALSSRRQRRSADVPPGAPSRGAHGTAEVGGSSARASTASGPQRRMSIQTRRCRLATATLSASSAPFSGQSTPGRSSRRSAEGST